MMTTQILTAVPAGSASAGPTSGAALMAERMGAVAQAAAAEAGFRGMPEGYGAAPTDGFRSLDGFAGGPGGAAALGGGLAQRAQLQVCGLQRSSGCA